MLGAYTFGPVSGVLHPVGPEAPAVYWLRRAAIVLVLLTIAVVVWRVFLSGGGDSSDAATPAPTASAEVTAAATTQPTSAATPDPNATPLECADEVIRVEATTDAGTYTLGSTPRLTLMIENVGSVPCVRDVGPKANELVITSGGYHVWSSDDCSASDKSKLTTLEPGAPVASSITWNGRLSSKGCPDGDEGAQAKAGRYDVVGRNGGVESESSPFALTDA